MGSSSSSSSSNPVATGREKESMRADASTQTEAVELSKEEGVSDLMRGDENAPSAFVPSSRSYMIPIQDVRGLLEENRRLQILLQQAERHLENYDQLQADLAALVTVHSLLKTQIPQVCTDDLRRTG